MNQDLLTFRLNGKPDLFNLSWSCVCAVTALAVLPLYIQNLWVSILLFISSFFWHTIYDNNVNCVLSDTPPTFYCSFVSIFLLQTVFYLVIGYKYLQSPCTNLSTFHSVSKAEQWLRSRRIHVFKSLPLPLQEPTFAHMCTHTSFVLIWLRGSHNDWKIPGLWPEDVT